MSMQRLEEMYKQALRFDLNKVDGHYDVDLVQLDDRGNATGSFAFDENGSFILPTVPRHHLNEEMHGEYAKFGIDTGNVTVQHESSGFDLFENLGINLAPQPSDTKDGGDGGQRVWPLNSHAREQVRALLTDGRSSILEDQPSWLWATNMNYYLGQRSLEVKNNGRLAKTILVRGYGDTVRAVLTGDRYYPLFNSQVVRAVYEIMDKKHQMVTAKGGEFVFDIHRPIVTPDRFNSTFLFTDERIARMELKPVQGYLDNEQGNYKVGFTVGSEETGEGGFFIASTVQRTSCTNSIHPTSQRFTMTHSQLKAIVGKSNNPFISQGMVYSMVMEHMGHMLNLSQQALTKMHEARRHFINGSLDDVLEALGAKFSLTVADRERMRIEAEYNMSRRPSIFDLINAFSGAAKYVEEPSKAMALSSKAGELLENPELARTWLKQGIRKSSKNLDLEPANLIEKVAFATV